MTSSAYRRSSTSSLPVELASGTRKIHPSFGTLEPAEGAAHGAPVTIAAAGAIEPLVALARGGSEEQRECAAGALANLALNAANRAAMERLGHTL